MATKPVFAATLEEIKNEFGLKRRRSADVLVNSALRKFRTNLAIMAIMSLLYEDHESGPQTDEDLDKVADIFVGLYRSGQLSQIAGDYLHGRSYGA